MNADNNSNTDKTIDDTIETTSLTGGLQGQAECEQTRRSSSSSSSFVTIVVARHGERQDYVVRDSGGNWVQSAPRPWDPPLSEHGLEQGYKLGTHLVGELKRLDLPPIAGIYTSPLLRCRQTAVQARKGILDALSRNDDKHDKQQPQKVRVEMGLVESINDSWYRSWACKKSDGTWGLRQAFRGPEDVATLHPRALEPVQGILSEWSSHWILSSDTNSENHFDLNYESLTKVEEPYTFHPHFVESDDSQRARMRQAVTLVAAKHEADHKDGTLLFFSHGAPVTHLFESLTGRLRKDHGTSSYCCYSIYRVDKDAFLKTLKEGGNDIVYWEALQINQAEYLHEKIVREEHISTQS
ncbi:hypothetical protein ACA910_016839 [Epithemia clementina (nom. ined.)]